MTVSATFLKARIDAELAQLCDRRVTDQIRGLLVPPRIETRAWDYGGPDEAYPCWIVLEHPASRTGIAYCAHGFGPRTPWGLLFLDGPYRSMGMDSGWFSRFLDAYFESHAPADLAIWRVFRRDRTTYPGVPITDEADWASTWAKVEELRAADPEFQYDCRQTIHSPA